ncbi:MAG: hypothetical protein RR595_13420 [Lysinibacillus sp.]
MSHRFQKGMFIYPWDIATTGIKQVIEDFKEVGCNTLVVNSSYHQGRFLHPQKQDFHYVNQSAISFKPNLTRYKRLKPFVHQDMVDQNILAQAREHCEQSGMDFVTWWVGLHNSSLGRQNPDLCIQNIWGNRYTYALCPSQPEVRHYVAALFEDTLDTVKPHRIITESIAFLPMKHGEHHELILLDLGKSSEWLLSLCFCDACSQNAENEGIDTVKVQQLVQQLVQERLDCDLGSLEEDAYELSHLMLEYPELYNYQQARMNSVTQLVNDLSTIARKYGVGFDYIPSSTPFPANQSFFEGVSLQQTAKVVDRFMALGYSTPESTQHTLRTVSSFTPGRANSLALSLHAQINASKDSLLSHIQATSSWDVDAIYYYNYGLLNKRRWSWIKEANEFADQIRQSHEEKKVAKCE